MKEDGSPILAKNNAGTLTFRNQADDTTLTLTATAAAHTHAPADVIGTAVIDNDARLTNDRTPTAHTDSVHSGSAANLLTGLTPTFTNWTTNPGTNANLVDELSTAILTTAGVSKAAPGSQIDYDLVTSRRRMVWLNASTSPFTIWFSDDNNTWYQNTASTMKDIFAIGKFRYVRFELIGVATTSYLKLRVYNIN